MRLSVVHRHTVPLKRYKPLSQHRNPSYDTTPPSKALPSHCLWRSCVIIGCYDVALLATWSTHSSPGGTTSYFFIWLPSLPTWPASEVLPVSSYRRHSSMAHGSTRAPPPHQGLATPGRTQHSNTYRKLQSATTPNKTSPDLREYLWVCVTLLCKTYKQIYIKLYSIKVKLHSHMLQTLYGLVLWSGNTPACYSYSQYSVMDQSNLQYQNHFNHNDYHFHACGQSAQ